MWGWCKISDTLSMGVLRSARSLETNHDVSTGIVLLAKWACYEGGVHAEYSLAIMVQLEPKVGE